MNRKIAAFIATGITAGLAACSGSSAVETSQAPTTSPSGCQGYVALTYDDGPTEFTRPLSAALKEAGLRGTFFVRGDRAKADPAALKQVIADGHYVESHSMNHLSLPKLNLDAAAAQLAAASKVIERATGERPQFFRPPYGDTNPAIRAIGKEQGMTEVIWTLGTRDWEGKSAELISAIIVGVKPGAVILMHDSSQATVDAVPLIAQTLAKDGLCTGRLAPSEVATPVWQDLDQYVTVVAPDAPPGAPK